MGNPIGGVPASGVTQQLTPAAVTPRSEKAGQSNGRAFVASNPASLIAISNMSEEATVLVANHKKSSDFKISKGKSPSERQLELIEKIKIVEEIQGVEDFKRSFPEESKSGLNREEYREGAKKQFKDPNHQYVALYELAVDFKAQPDDEIFQAIEELEKEHPKYIKVGLKISDAAELLAKKYHGDSYTQINEKVFGHVKDHKSLSAAFKDLSKNPEVTDFESTVDVRLRALSAELNMMTTQTEDTHLRSVINDMTAVKRLMSIHDTCMDAQGEMRRPPNSVEKFDGEQYMAMILVLLDKSFVTNGDFVSLLDDMDLREQTIPVKTAFINKTAALIRDIPQEIFANEQVKASLSDAIQAEQDDLALAEEGGGALDKDFGKVGEVDVNLDGFMRSGGILDDLGVSVTGTKANLMPNLIPVQNIAVNPLPDDIVPVQDPDINPLSDDIVPTEKAQIEASNNTDKNSTDSAKSTTAEDAATGSIDGLPDKELMEKQDVLLDKARDLQAKKDKDFVYGSAVTGLEHALNDDPDILKALNVVAKERGKGIFAKGLKIAITPEGSGKELRLIPPDNDALRAWQAQNPDKRVVDLVRVAIDVLKDSRDSGIDFEKINNELASLKGAISDIDQKIKKKPFMRSQGGETFERLEYSHKFKITAEQSTAGAISAEADTPEKDGVSAQKEKAKAALKEQQMAPVMGNQWEMPTVPGSDTPSGDDITPLVDEDNDGNTMND